MLTMSEKNLSLYKKSSTSASCRYIRRRRLSLQQHTFQLCTPSIFYNCYIMMIIAMIVTNVMNDYSILFRDHQRDQNNNNLVYPQFGSIITMVQAMKHTFEIDHTSRTIIGPIGIPFGFNKKGFYKLSVSNFEVQLKFTKNEKDKKKVALSLQEQKELFETHYEAGFYLQRYDTIASFHQHYNKLVNNIQNYYNRTTTSTSTISGGSTHTTTMTTIKDTCSFAHWWNDEISERAGINNRQRQLPRQHHQRMLQNIYNDDIPMDDLDGPMGNNGNDNDVDDYPLSTDGNYPNDNTYDDAYATNQNDGTEDLSVPSPSKTSVGTLTNNNDDQAYFENSYYTSAQPDGIYMSMNSISTRIPNQRQVNYTFQAYVDRRLLVLLVSM